MSTISCTVSWETKKKKHGFLLKCSSEKSNMANQGRPYQGYPYLNPTVIDIPSIDPETAAKWTNLPRKPIMPTHGTTGDNLQKKQGSWSANEKIDPSETPVVYIDLPETSGRQAHSSDNSRTQISETELKDPGSEKVDPAEEPRVYINLNDDDDEVETDPGFIQETILYDQFTDTRIEVPRSTSSASPGLPRYKPPTTLNLNSPSSSGYSSHSTLPSLMQKETTVYARPTPEDDFSLSPIPVTEFPEPPPAYSEVDTRQDARVTIPELPRTQVIGPNVPQPGSDEGRQLDCQHCGHTVTTILELKAGLLTHVVACALLICCLIPCIPVIYCTTICKYHNHYCPRCFKMIGYEIPVMCRRIVYVKE